MIKAFENSTTLSTNEHREKEIVYVYKNEDQLKDSSKDKFIVEIPKERPKWFNNNLMEKVTTKK